MSKWNILIDDNVAREVRRMLEENDKRSDDIMREALSPDLVATHENVMNRVVAFHKEISDNLDRLVRFEAATREFASAKVELEMVQSQAHSQQHRDLTAKMDEAWNKLRVELEGRPW